MHELSLVGAIADKALEVMAAEGASRLVSVRLTLGVLSCARREALEFCFPLAIRDTALAGATLIIEDEALSLACQRCGETTRSEVAQLVCGVCGSLDVDVTGGRDLVIASVEVADEVADV